jgi:hypothetical protein
MSENVVLARVYKHTVQRLVCELSQLNSAAAFLFVCSEPSRVFVWLGESCSTEDALYSEQIAHSIIEEDFLGVGSVDVIKENREDEAVLGELLEALWLTPADYRALESSSRKVEIHNKPMSLGIVERRKGSRELRMKFLSEERTLTNGAVKPLVFPQVMNTKTVCVVIVGDNYDVLIGNDVTKPEQAAIKLYVINYALEAVDDAHKAVVATQFSSRNLKMYKKEGPKLFKLYFRSDTVSALNGAASVQPNRTKARSPNNLNRRAAIKKTDVFTNTCTDCVGDTIMSLLGMRFTEGDSEDGDMVSHSDENSSCDESEYVYNRRAAAQGSPIAPRPRMAATNKNTPAAFSARTSASASGSGNPNITTTDAGNGHSNGSEDGFDGYMDITSSHVKIPYVADAEDLVPDEYGEHPSMFDPALVAAKIARAQLRTNIQYFHPPRKGFALLVLDLDHTLMDFSQRYNTKNVLRPHLFQFLKEVSVISELIMCVIACLSAVPYLPVSI